MNKIAILGFMFAIICSGQTFSEGSQNSGLEVGNFNRFNDAQPYKSYNTVDGLKRNINEAVFSKKKYDTKSILSKFKEWAYITIRELKLMNPEMLNNEAFITGYLLGTAIQTNANNSKFFSAKGWENTFSDLKKSVYKSTESSTHEMLYVFIYAFSPNQYDGDEVKIEKEQMRTIFTNILKEETSNILAEKETPLLAEMI